MKRHFSILVLLLFTFSVAVLAADVPKYEVVGHYVVGGEGGWDYVTYDSDNDRLFIPRGTHTIVLDAASGKQLGDIPETPGVHGVALIPELGIGLISNGRAGTVSVFDLKSLKKTAEVKAGTNPDAIMYDPASKRVFVFNGRSQDATVIDPMKPAAISTIPLGGKPEFAVADLKGHVFVNIEDKAEIAEIDSQKMTVVARWPLVGCEEPSGLAIDRKNAKLFSVCASKVMTVVDASTGKLVATVPIGAGADAAAFDPETHLAFSSNGEGTVTVIHQDSPDKYSVVQTVNTAKGARTMALDPKSHKVYLVTAKFGPAPAPTAEQPRPRPPMIPDSFEVIVVGAK
jgi:YVTN family beta-propeller protein